ncbi:hypothetical protein MalM25_27740 [Planctomycetes bacterium MalM25]|nr:hypothetical protein MalM25_27740 [Planctomycetes bacterium MalM25]
MPRLVPRRFVVGRLAILIIAGLLTGCGGDSIDARVAALNSTNIQKLYNCYSLFQHYNGYRAPKDEAEFKEFLLRPRYAKNLSRMQIDPANLDAIFVSERDGEPFRIRYGVNGLGDKAIVFEATGVEGRRLVAMQEAQELDDAEYEAHWSGKKRPKAYEVQQGEPE